MPLTRPVANPPLATTKGVQFAMTDRSKIVRCIITQAGLEKLAQHELTIDQFERVFERHRDRIESITSHKYDASPVLYTPLTIKPADLVAYQGPIEIGHSPSRQRRYSRSG